jgi:hypothetical protein
MCYENPFDFKNAIEKELANIVKDKTSKDFIIKEAERIASLPKSQRQNAINTVIANVIDDFDGVAIKGV